MSKVYTHNQTEPSDEWVITHDLGPYPASDILINDVDDSTWKTLPFAIEHVDENTIVVRFTSARTGTVRLIGSSY